MSIAQYAYPELKEMNICNLCSLRRKTKNYLKLIEGVLADVEESIKKQAISNSTTRIVEEVEAVTGINVRCAKRKRDGVVIRQYLMLHIHENHNYISLKEIGRMFGGRDHSTVIYSLKCAKNMEQTNDELYMRWKNLLTPIIEKYKAA